MESFLVHAGYGALILLAFLEGCCVPIPSEITFGFAGVLASQGHLNLALVIVLGSLAELAGSYVSYFVGRVAALLQPTPRPRLLLLAVAVALVTVSGLSALDAAHSLHSLIEFAQAAA